MTIKYNGMKPNKFLTAFTNIMEILNILVINYLITLIL